MLGFYKYIQCLSTFRAPGRMKSQQNKPCLQSTDVLPSSKHELRLARRALHFDAGSITSELLVILRHRTKLKYLLRALKCVRFKYSKSSRISANLFIHHGVFSMRRPLMGSACQYLRGHVDNFPSYTLPQKALQKVS